VRKLSQAAALAAAALLATTVCSGSSRTPISPSITAAVFVVSTTVSNGRVELALMPAYKLGSTATIPVTIIATRGSITGPIVAKVLASGVNEGGAPAELVVRTLAPRIVTARPGATQTIDVSWDGNDEKGALVPADAYSLRLDFRIDDGAAPHDATATATLQMNAP
jgi:hypothetical protein